MILEGDLIDLEELKIYEAKMDKKMVKIRDMMKDIPKDKKQMEQVSERIFPTSYFAYIWAKSFE